MRIVDLSDYYDILNFPALRVQRHGKIFDPT